MSDEPRTTEDKLSGPEMAQFQGKAIVRAAKSHQDFWKERLQKRAYLNADGERVTMPEWHVRIAFKGRREWFNLNTANAALASQKARDVYMTLVTHGWEKAQRVHKPGSLPVPGGCTVGEYLAQVSKNGHLTPKTLRSYAVKLRKMVSDIAALEKGAKIKSVRSKFDYVNGGNAAWLKNVEGQSLSILTHESVSRWRNEYVARAPGDPLAQKSAARSAASYLRCCKALFSQDITSVLPLELPANPFTQIKVKDPGLKRYQSTFDLSELVAAAALELKKNDPQLYSAIILTLWGGLRRKEADLLTWEQVNFSTRQVEVRRTEVFAPKSEESERVIDLPATVVQFLKRQKSRSTSVFVLEGSDPRPLASYDYYRCDRLWRRLNAWLGGKGVRDGKKVHALRKESGSVVAAEFGVEAARHHLGHRDIRTTSMSYVTKKKRIEVKIPE